MGTSQSSNESAPRRQGSPIVWSIAFAAIFGLIAVGCASYGWWIHDGRPPPPRDFTTFLNWLDIPVRGVQALLLSDIYYEDRYSAEAIYWLQIARISGAVFSLFVAGRFVFRAVGRNLAHAVLRSRRGHVVIFGDGPATNEFIGLAGFRKITQIARNLEASSGDVAHLPAGGSLVSQVAESSARRASHLLVCEENDDKTWQVALSLARVVPSAEIVAILKGAERKTPEPRLRSVSFCDGAARHVMLAHPPYLLAKAMSCTRQHILIVGFGRVGQALLREFLVTCPVHDPAEMMVTVVAENIEGAAADFRAHSPDIGLAVDIAFVEGDYVAASDAVIEKVELRQKDAEFCAVYVTVSEFGQDAERADALRSLALKRHLFRAPIFNFAEHDAAMTNVRQGAGLLGPAMPDDEAAHHKLQLAGETQGLLVELLIVQFGTWRDALDGAGLLAPDLDAQARAFHAAYLAIANPDGISKDEDVHPSSRSWAHLPGDFRDSNRRAAAHIRAKCYAAGFDVGSWLGQQARGRLSHELPPAASLFDENDEEFVARMSALEHRRWMLDRLLSGWTPGEVRSNYRKVHNMLRPYEELDASEKAKDTTMVEVTRSVLKAVTSRR